MQTQSRRQLRMGELVKRELTPMLRQFDYEHADFNAAIINLNEVRMSADLKIAYPLITALDRDDVNEIVSFLNYHAKIFQAQLGHKIKAKFTPKLKFIGDDTRIQARKIDQLITSLNK